MDLVVYATPVFGFAILAEWLYGLRTGHNTYRVNDSISSLFLGILNQTRRFVTLGVGGYVYHLVTQYASLPLLDASHWSTWLLAMLVYDFCYYWLHRLGHERSILWAAHVAHHQSEDYNLTTALRQTSTGFLLGWLFYLPMYLLGIPAWVVVTVGSISLLYQFWVHTEHVPKLGWLEWLLVTPSNHRVHHAQNTVYLDRNYGGILILWDRLFGTFQEELPEEPCIYGIRGALHSWNPVKALTHIYGDMCLDSWRATHWADKLRVWVARTGWRPADVESRWPRPKPDLSQFQKYDPPVSGAVACYSLLQLVAMVALLHVMQRYEPDYWVGVALCGFMVATMVLTAMWLEGRHPNKTLRAWEMLRLTAVAAGLALGLVQGIPGVLLAAVVVYGVLNLICLLLMSDLRRSGAQGHAVPALQEPLHNPVRLNLLR